MGASAPWGMCGGQRTPIWRQLSPSTMWVLGIELRSSGLVASSFTHWTISLAWHYAKIRWKNYFFLFVSIMSTNNAIIIFIKNNVGKNFHGNTLSHLMLKSISPKMPSESLLSSKFRTKNCGGTPSAGRKRQSCVCRLCRVEVTWVLMGYRVGWRRNHWPNVPGTLLE